MTTTTPTKDLTPLFKAGRIALRDQSKTLTQVAETFLEPESTYEPSTEMVPFPAVPKTPILTDEDKAALALLPSVYGKVEVTERRMLTAEQIAAVHVERQTVKTVTKVLKGREDVLNEYVRHHVDVDHESRGVAVPKAVVRGGKVIVEATPRDAAGHYILAKPQEPTRVNIPGTNQAFSLEFSKGSDAGVTIDSGDLLDLYETGEITRAQYLAVTREVRVFDEVKATQAIIKDESLLEVIAKVSKRVKPGKPHTSLFIRAAK